MPGAVAAWRRASVRHSSRRRATTERGDTRQSLFVEPPCRQTPTGGYHASDARSGERLTMHRRLIRLAGAPRASSPAAYRRARTAYPSRPVRILVGYAAGGGIDIAAPPDRTMAVGAAQPAVRRREPDGAATNIATEAVVRSPPDGYTLLLVNAANAINATLLREPQLRLRRATSRGRGHRARPLRHGGQPVAAGEDRRRVHRLRQGQSAQGQHGHRRRRRPGPRLRRAAPSW